MESWKCICQPANVMLYVGAYKCTSCDHIVVALKPDEENKLDPCITNYHFCPFCGVEKNTHLTSSTNYDIIKEKEVT